MSAREAYRHLLRTVDSHITRVNGNTQWRDHIRTLFRAHSGESSAEDGTKKIELAEDYAFLVNSVQEQKVRCLDLVMLLISRFIESCFNAQRQVGPSLIEYRNFRGPATAKSKL